MTTKKPKSTTPKNTNKEAKPKGNEAQEKSAPIVPHPNKVTEIPTPLITESITPSASSSRSENFSHTSNRTEERLHVLGSLDRGLDDVDRVLARGNTDILLDFAGCPFITVDGLEWLEELLMRAASMQSNIRFINIYPAVYKTFKVSRIDSILKACGGPGPSTGPVC